MVYITSIEEVNLFSLKDLIIDSMKLQIWNQCYIITRTNEAIYSIINISCDRLYTVVIIICNDYHVCSRCSE
jgi:hypothetical protein